MSQSKARLQIERDNALRLLGEAATIIRHQTGQVDEAAAALKDVACFAHVWPRDELKQRADSALAELAQPPTG